MYNDYYLQQINENLETIQEQLQDITKNQQAIIQNQYTEISGDKEIKETILITHQNTINGLIIITIFVIAILLYQFFNFIFNKKG